MDFFFLYMDFLIRYNIVLKANLTLIKITLFQVCKQVVFFKFSQNLSHSFHITLFSIFEQNKDIIIIYNDKNIKFFCQGSIEVVLKFGGRVEKIKNYDLILEITISHLKNHFHLIIFPILIQ